MSTFCNDNFAVPLAQRELWEALGSRFSGDEAKFNGQDWWLLLGVVVLLAGFFTALNWFYRRQQSRKESNEPRHLFEDLCAAHRLSRKDRKLLRQLAESHVLDSPGALFLRPDLFQQANLPVQDEQELARYRQLADKLFKGLDALEPSKETIVGHNPVQHRSTPTVIVPAVGTGIMGDANVQATGK